MFELTDDDDLFNFENENFLQDVFDSNKIPKNNKADTQLPKSPMKETSLSNVSLQNTPRNMFNFNLPLPTLHESRKPLNNLDRRIPGPSTRCVSFRQRFKETLSPLYRDVSAKTSCQKNFLSKTVCTTQNLTSFESAPWLNMLSECELSKDLILQINIAWILNKAMLKELPKGKVPLLIVSLKTILEKVSGANSVILEDQTGKIQGTIHWKSATDIYANLQPGAVLLLRQVSVFSPKSHRHYLNITPNNIMCIMQSDTSQDRICSFTKNQLAAKICLWLKEAGSNYFRFSAKKDNIKDFSDYKLNDISTARSTTVEDKMCQVVSPTVSEVSEEEASFWNEDDFGMFHDEFDQFLEDDDADEMIAKLDF